MKLEETEPNLEDKLPDWGYIIALFVCVFVMYVLFVDPGIF